jgi:septal ring factor EnvC (AmiA/AmiB activator)
MATLNEKTTPKRTENMLNELEKSLVEACLAGPLKSFDPAKFVPVLGDIILRMNKELEETSEELKFMNKELGEKDIKIQDLNEALKDLKEALKEALRENDHRYDQFESNFGITR